MREIYSCANPNLSYSVLEHLVVIQLFCLDVARVWAILRLVWPMKPTIPQVMGRELKFGRFLEVQVWCACAHEREKERERERERDSI
jgi:hypothetical protein